MSEQGVIPVYQKAEAHLRAPNVKVSLLMQQAHNTITSGHRLNNHLNA